MGTSVQTWRLDPDGLTSLSLIPAPETLDGASQRLPPGVYTTFRTYNTRTRVIGLTAHLNRLEDSAVHLGHFVTLEHTQVRAARAALRHVLTTVASAEARVRLTLDTSDRPGTLYISVEPLRVPAAELYRDGVRAVTHRLQRSRPAAKTTDFIAPSRALKASLPDDVFEVIMVDAEGYLLEGMTSNIFGIVEGVLRTAAIGVLMGITRGVVLALAREVGIPVTLRRIALEEVPALDEAFLTSSSRGIVPIVQIDKHRIGAGIPGPITRRLMEDYAAHLDDVCEPI